MEELQEAGVAKEQVWGRGPKGLGQPLLGAIKGRALSWGHCVKICLAVMENRSEGATVALGRLGGGWDDDQMGEAGTLVSARWLDSGGKGRGPVMFRRKIRGILELIVLECTRSKGSDDLERVWLEWMRPSGVQIQKDSELDPEHTGG